MDYERGWSPMEIHTLLHIYCRATPIENADAPAIMEALREFEHVGLIRECGNEVGWFCTERGQAFIRMLLATPLPEEKFVDPRSMKVA